MTSFRRLAAVVLLAVPVVLLAGCGSGPSEQVVRTDDPAEAVMAAAEQSLAAGTQYTSMTATIDGEVVTSFEGVGSLDGTTFEGSMSMPGAGDVPYLVVDRAAYYGFPGLPDGVSWVQMSFEEMAEMGVDMDAASQQQGNQALAMLAGGGDVELVGDDDLDGVATTHFRAVVDVREAARSNGMVSDEMIDQATQVLGESVTMDVWIDADGYLRRMEYGSDLSKLPEPFPGMPEEGQLEYVFEMGEFGEPVDVVAPDDSEVISMTEFQEAMMGGLGDFTPVGDAVN